MRELVALVQTPQCLLALIAFFGVLNAWIEQRLLKRFPIPQEVTVAETRPGKLETGVTMLKAMAILLPLGYLLLETNAATANLVLLALVAAFLAIAYRRRLRPLLRAGAGKGQALALTVSLLLMTIPMAFLFHLGLARVYGATA